MSDVQQDNDAMVYVDTTFGTHTVLLVYHVLSMIDL